MKKLKIDQLLVLATLALSLVVVVLGVCHLHSERSKRVSIDTEGQPTMGNRNAPVEMVVFEEMKCAACRDFQMRIFPPIEERYIRSGKVKCTTIIVSFLPGSQLANLAVLTLYEQNKAYFYPFLNYLFEQQLSENVDWATADTLCDFASNIQGVDLADLRASLAEGRYAHVLDKNFALGEKVMKEEFATPAIFVNGVRVYAVTPHALTKRIEEALK